MSLHGTFFLTDLADAARSTGLDVIEVPGWRTRSAAPNGPGGTRYAGGRYGGPGMAGVESVMIHHTATPEKYHPELDYPTYNVILRGNGSTGGPLSQLGLCRCGRHLYVFAAGICWHAGAVREWWQGNPFSVGIEAEHSGMAYDMPWPRARYEGYVQAAHGIAKWYSVRNSRIVGHKEASTTGKIDPLFSMPTFRTHVATYRGTVLKPTPAPLPVNDGFTADHIERVQTILNELGYGPLDVDGSLGPATKSAVTEYQADHNLDADGLPGHGETFPHMEATMTTLTDRLDRLEAKLDAALGRDPWAGRVPFQEGTSLHNTFGPNFRAGALLGYAAQHAYKQAGADRDQIIDEIRNEREEDTNV
jgi:peptidoglycan hydrolase-like protein with peptidoglycan-binding domain